MTDEGVIGVLFISKSLKFMKDPTKLTTSDKFIASTSLFCNKIVLEKSATKRGDVGFKFVQHLDNRFMTDMF